MVSRQAKLIVLVGTLLLLCGAVQSLSIQAAWAGTAGVLPFSSNRGVPNGAADNIFSLVSAEIDIRGGYDLVLSASPDEVQSGCGERTTCISAYGSESDFEHVITGSVSTAGRTRYTLVLTLYLVRTGKAIRQVVNTLDRSPESLLDGIPDLVVELLTGQRPVHEEDKGNPRAGGNKAALFADGDDFGDDDQRSSAPSVDSQKEEKKQWMERDRHGRLTQPIDETQDPLGLDDVDDLDLDLDELSSEHQQKKRKNRKEREDAARARHAEDERLARVAEEERDRRDEERIRRQQQRARDEERLRRDEERRIEEEREGRRAEARRREDREDREDREREQLVDERRRRDERERERRSDEERRRDERDRERRIAEARFQEEAEAEERERRSSRDRYQADEEDVTLDAGIIIIESDDEEDEVDGDFEILIEADDGEPEERSYDRRDQEPERRGYEERSYDRPRQEDSSSYEERNERRSRSYDEPNEEEELNIDRRYDTSRSPRDSRNASGYSSSRNSRSEGSREADSRSRAGASTTRQPQRPPGAIRASVGYNYFYLSFLRLALEGNIYVLPSLSLDLEVQAWMLWLRTGEDLHLAARVLPNFLIGASYRMRFHPIVRPFIGGDVGTVVYATKEETSNNDIIRKTPLFALTLAVKGGSDFELGKNFGIFVSARVGVSISGDLEQDGLADIQQYVNETWSPTHAFFNVGVGARYRF